MTIPTFITHSLIVLVQNIQIVRNQFNKKHIKVFCYNKKHYSTSRAENHIHDLKILPLALSVYPLLGSLENLEKTQKLKNFFLHKIIRSNYIFMNILTRNYNEKECQTLNHNRQQ
ncbi:hypothetical protein pb186bvf_019532 [Paramecium bursaria]